MKKCLLLIVGIIYSYISVSAEEPATTGRVRMDIEVTDLAGINAKTKLITLQNVKASEVEPFIRNRLTQYGTVQVNDVLNALVITELEPKLSDLIGFIKELDKRGVQDFLRLETEAISLNYIAPISIDSVLKTRLSPDGSIQIHSDLNMIIITDVRSKIEDIKKVIASLDIPPKQVVITGEVLEVNSEYSRKIGLNWHAFPEVFPATLIDFSIEKGEELNWGASGRLSPEVLIQRVKQCINEGKGKLTSMPKNCGPKQQNRGSRNRRQKKNNDFWNRRSCRTRGHAYK